MAAGSRRRPSAAGGSTTSWRCSASRHCSAAGALRVPRLDLAPGSPLRVLIRARDVMIALQRPQGLSALNVLPATIADIGPTGGPVVALRLDCGGAPLVARLTRQSVQALGL